MKELRLDISSAAIDQVLWLTALLALSTILF
jgi:hypothetical protein